MLALLFDIDGNLPPLEAGLVAARIERAAL
jgi:hypothetical protein